MFGGIVLKITLGAEYTSDFIKQVGGFFQEAFTQIGHELLKTVDRIKIWTTDFLSNLDDVIKQGADYVREKAIEFFAKVSSAIDSAVALLSNMADGVKNFVSGAASVISGAVSYVAEGTAAVAQRVFNELKTGVENTVNVMISAFSNAKDKTAEIAKGIMKDLSAAVKEVVLGQKVTWESILNDVVSNLEAFTNGFEAKIPSLVNVSIRDVDNRFERFYAEFTALSKHSNISLQHRGSPVSISGGVAHSGIYAALGNMKISVSLADLRRLRSQAEDLLREIDNRVNVTTRARSQANDSMRQYSQSYVRTEGNAVINACSQLESDTSKTRNELNTLIRGLTASIDGYGKLEREFA